MLKYLRLILVCGPRIMWSYFAWMLKYAAHPERYPLEKRYKRIRDLVLFVFRHLHIDAHVHDGHYFLEQKQPVVVYANHYSDIDPLLMISLSEKPITFVAKKETLNFPFIGKVVKILEGVTIDRSDLRSQVSAIDHAVNMLQTGRTIVIFPEGTRSRNPATPIGEFKPGAFKLSYRTGAPIIPCALFGTFRPLSSKSNLKVYPLWARFFKPIEKGEYLQINTVDLAPRVQDMVQKEIDGVMRINDLKYLENLKIAK